MSKHEYLVNPTMKKRFRGFLPVIVDVETTGVCPQTNALLEMCVVLLDVNAEGHFFIKEHHFEHI